MRKLILFIGIFLFSSINVFAIIAPPVFNDVSNNHNYFEAIEFVYDEGIVDGYSDGSYRPDQAMNRAELLKIIMEAVYDDSDFDSIDSYADDNCFNDVPANEWYTKYVCAAKSTGIIVGYEGNTFKPDQYISLVETLKIVMDFYGFDYEVQSPWYKGIVEVASINNFIPLDFYFFDQLVNRGQMADLVTRIIKNDRRLLDEYLGDLITKRVTYESLRDEIKVDIEEDLISQVCGKDSPRGGDTDIYNCSTEKTDIYGCESVRVVDYYDYEFLQCDIWQADADEVLVYGGGIGGYGYNLIGDQNGTLKIINSYNDLFNYWGTFDSDESVREFAMAATGNSEAYDKYDLKDLYGDDIIFEDSPVVVIGSEVDEVSGVYTVTLYDQEVYGCLEFSIYEITYEIDEDDETFVEKDSTTIAVETTGYCAD